MGGGSGGDPGQDLLERRDAVETTAGDSRAVEQKGLEARGTGPLVVLGGRVADVEHLVGGHAGEGEGRVEDLAGGLGGADERRDDDAVEMAGQVEAVEEGREIRVPVTDDEELQSLLAQGRQDLEDLRVDAPALGPGEVLDQVVEEPFGERSATDPREDLLDKPAPEALFSALLAPARLAPRLTGGDEAPGGVERLEDGLVRRRDPPAPEGPSVDAFDRRVRREERVAGVEEDRFRRIQGITCPPSMTIDWPVTFRASSDTSQATRPATS